MKRISRWPSSAATPIASCWPAPPRTSSSTRRPTATCRCGSNATNASACRPTARATSSWSARAPASRRSAASCRSARRPAPTAATGCSSAAARCTTTSSTSSSGSRRSSARRCTGVDVAFSRDQAAEDLRAAPHPRGRQGTCSPGFRMARISMCAATRRAMAPDVNAALIDVVRDARQHGRRRRPGLGGRSHR